MAHAVLTVNYVVQDGKSNWLEGMILICTYSDVPLPAVFVLTAHVTRSLSHPLCHFLVLPRYVAVLGRQALPWCPLARSVVL